MELAPGHRAVIAGGMTNNPLSGWMAFLASPAAPATAMRPLELEGFLTGLAVSPEVIPPSIWAEYIWGEQEPLFDNQEQAYATLAGVLGHYTFISGQIDNQLYGKEPTWLPMYFGNGHVANVEQCAQWVKGFWKAAALAPDIWLDLADHPRAQMLIEPFALFPEIASDTIDLGLAVDELEEARRMSAEYIPSILPAMRKLAQILAERAVPPFRTTPKIGRNEPCPCGSGKKYKRCCALNRT